jgi:hypothetical protein
MQPPQDVQLMYVNEVADHMETGHLKACIELYLESIETRSSFTGPRELDGGQIWEHQSQRLCREDELS